MNNGVGQKIIEKLDLLIRLSALNLLKNTKVQDQVKFLSESGLQPSDIAVAVGKTPNYVSAVLSNIRKQEKDKQRGTRGKKVKGD